MRGAAVLARDAKGFVVRKRTGPARTSLLTRASGAIAPERGDARRAPIPVEIAPR